MMETRKNKKIIIIAILNFVLLYSCVMDYKPFLYSVRNCTSDTLLIDLSESDTLNWHSMFWDKHTLDSIEIAPEDTTEVYINGEKMFVSNYYYALPDSTTMGGLPINRWRTYYIYAVKLQVAKKYSIKEIRAKKLYDRRTVTKKDFHDRVYDYKLEK